MRNVLSIVALAACLRLVVAGCDDGPTEASSPDLSPSDLGPPPLGLERWIWRNPLPSGDGLMTAAYGKGLFVGAGQNGEVLTSPDGSAWTLRATLHCQLYEVLFAKDQFLLLGVLGDSFLTWRSVDGIRWDRVDLGIPSSEIFSGGGLFLAVGQGLLFRSDDGLTWTSMPKPAELGRMAYGNGVFVSQVCCSDKAHDIATSADGVHWTLRASAPRLDGGWNNGMFFGNGFFVQTGQNGRLRTSPDGITWTTRIGETGDWIYGVTTNGAFTLATTLSGAILSSTDGVTWTAVPTPSTGRLAWVAFGGGRFVASGDVLITSADGVTWTEPSPALTRAALRGIAFAKDLFVAVGDGGTIVTSPDGAHWTLRGSGTSSALRSVVFGNGTFVAGGDDVITTSLDGVTWAAQAMPLSSFSTLAYGGGTFVALAVPPGQNDQGYPVYASTDGKTWTAGDKLLALTYGRGSFLGERGYRTRTGYDSELLTSPDGKTWTPLAGTKGALFQGLGYAGDLYVGFGQGLGSGAAVSSDGLNWIPLPTSPLRAVAATAGAFVGVGGNSSISTSPDGMSWTGQRWDFLGERGSLWGAAYGNGTFVVVGDHGSILQSERH